MLICTFGSRLMVWDQRHEQCSGLRLGGCNIGYRTIPLVANMQAHQSISRIKAPKNPECAKLHNTVRPSYGPVGGRFLKTMIGHLFCLNEMTFTKQRRVPPIISNVHWTRLKQYICQLILGGNGLEGDRVQLV